MNRLALLIFIIAVGLVLFSCSMDSPVAPQSSGGDQSPAPLAKKIITHFTGTSNFVQPISPGTTTVLPNGKTQLKGMVAEWYDSASDPRVTGQSIWTVNQLLKPDGTGKTWGTAVINVDNSGGKWEMTWRGKITETHVIGYAKGRGTEGAVAGLRAKWKYTLTFANGFFHVSEGHIIAHEK